MLYLMLAFGVFIVYIFWLYAKPRNFPPGPPCLPIVGSIPFFNLKKQPLYHIALLDTAKKWGCDKGIMGLRFGMNLTIAVWDPELVREALTREEFQGRPDGFVFRLRTYGKRLGLFFAEGPAWVEQRRFCLRQLRDIGILGLHKVQDVVHSEIVELLQHIRTHPKGSLEGSWLLQGTGLFTVNIVNVLWTLMSGKSHSHDDPEFKHLNQLLTRTFRDGDVSSGLLNAFPFIRFIAPKMSTYSDQKETIETLHEFVAKVVEEHRSTLNKTNVRDFIDSYLLEMEAHSSGKDTSFTDQQLISVCSDFFAAGTESVGNTLSFALLYLVLHPDVQVRIWEEMKREIGGICCPSLEDRARLPYLEAVIQEVMRINPIAPISVPRRSTRDSIFGGYSIPKGTWLHISLWSLGHDTSKWPEPDEFRPENFLDKDDKLIHDDSTLPFGAELFQQKTGGCFCGIPPGLCNEELASEKMVCECIKMVLERDANVCALASLTGFEFVSAGKRVCIGNSFARSCIFLFLSGLIANFEFRLVPGDPTPSVVSLPGLTTAPQPFRVLAIERKR